MERRAFSSADASTVLGHSDLDYAVRNFDLPESRRPVFLPPGIRADVAAIPPPLDANRFRYQRMRCMVQHAVLDKVRQAIANHLLSVCQGQCVCSV